MTLLQKHEYVRRELRAKKLHELPALSLTPDGAPVCILTNCCIYPFDETRHARTATKTYYEPTGERHMLNVTAAAAIKLMERGQRVIMHVPEEIRVRMEELIALHPRAALCRLVTGDIYKRSILEVLYGAVTNMADTELVSRIDFCLYDSYASGLSRPFLPMFEDDPATAGRLAAERTNFLFYFSMMAYDLLTRCGQAELRFVCPTALAAKRPSSHLFTDTIHKAVSNVLLRTLGYELPYYCDKPARIVEVAPGIVDSGLYDELSVREATHEESVMDGFPLMHGPLDVHAFPMLCIDVLAEVCVAYLIADTDKQLATFVSEEVRDVTRAGRSHEELRATFEQLTVSQGDGIIISQELPEYCYMPGTVWGGLPPIHCGYTSVMLTPPGQYF